MPTRITSGPQGDWPGNSPDLNPIENAWAIMQARIFEKNPPKTVEMLKKCIKQEWKNLKSETLENLVSGVSQRLKDVIKKKGVCIGK